VEYKALCEALLENTQRIHEWNEFLEKEANDLLIGF
jgi:hypothetical protein